ncbi:MAG: hypothetical protein SNI70_06225 [Rikenellaceae bacterium]
MADNKVVSSNRERYAERLKSKYPDKEYSDDESLFGQINDDYDDYDNQLASYQERESSLANLFASNPRSASFLIDWRNGEDPIVGLVRKFGDDFKAALEDPEKQEVLALANKEYADRISKESDYEEQYKLNISETSATIDQMVQGGEISDEDADVAMEFLIQIMKDAILGKFTRESILMATKAIKYDGDIEQADQEGEVRGRNTKIEEKLRQDSRSDGTADLQGKNGGGQSPPMPDLGALDRYDDGVKDIWERGGETRTRHNR